MVVWCCFDDLRCLGDCLWVALGFVVSGVLWFVAFGLIGLCFVVRLVSGGFWLCGLDLSF